MYEDQGYELSDEQRKEIVDMGLPDDGYNYLRHLKALGLPKAAGVEVGTHMRPSVNACV